MAEIQQVFIITQGSYSDYRIVSVWLTREDAERAFAAIDGDCEPPDIEVWPVGDIEQTRGAFTRRVEFDARTGEQLGDPVTWDYPGREENNVEVLAWDDNDVLAIQVIQETAERADKVMSEVRARVLADISMGLPKEAIASKISVRRQWQSTRPAPTPPR